MLKVRLFIAVFIMVFSAPMISAAAGEMIDYDKGLQKVIEYRKSGQFKDAEELLRRMLRRYRNNTELLELLAQTLYWEKRYDESIRTYEGILRLKNDPRIRAEMAKVSLAREFDTIDDLTNQGFSDEAERRLQRLYESGRTGQRAGRRLINFYIKERKYDSARMIAEQMKERYPDDTGIEALYVETLILTGEISMAKERLARMREEKRKALYESRDDLFYRVRRNYLSLEYTRLHYSNGLNDEQRYDVRIRQRIRERTVVLGYSNIDRFGQNDNQAGIEIYSKLGELTKRWGYIAGTFSPSPDFLPRWTASAAVYQGVGIIDLTIGYTHMSFEESRVDLLKPGFIMYLPYHLAWSETVYYNLDEGTSTLISKLHYEPNHKFNAFYSYSFGKSSEEIGAEADIVKVDSYSHLAGAEYRFTDRFSAGAKYRFSHRAMLHDKEGYSIFIKYWW